MPRQMSGQAGSSRQKKSSSIQLLSERRNRGRNQGDQKGEKKIEKTSAVIFLSDEESDEESEKIEVVDVEAMLNACSCARKKPIPPKRWREEMKKEGRILFYGFSLSLLLTVDCWLLAIDC